MKLNLKLAINTILLGGALSTSAFAADKELLDTLLSNGSINKAQHEELLKKDTAGKTEKSSIDDVSVKLDKKGLRFESADKAFKLKIGGRIHADFTQHINGSGIDGNAGATNGMEIRRGRIHLKGTVWNDFNFVSQFDFADNKVGIKDLYLQYTGLDWLNITVGNQKQAMSMELQESSNDIMFTERSLVDSLAAHTFDRALGINLKTYGHDWHAQVGLYGDAIAKPTDAFGVSSRASYAPINTKTQVLHLGASVGYKDLRGNNQKFGYETTHMSNLDLTGYEVKGVEGLTMFGVESAYMYGPASIQGQYLHTWLSRTDTAKPDVDFNAWYVQMSWTLTGESRTYKGSDGKFKRLKPKEEFSFSKGTWGAWELATRFDGNDLESGDVHGGKETAVTLALNWYLNENIRIMADYRTAFDVQNSPAEGDVRDVQDVHAFTIRTQLAF